MCICIGEILLLGINIESVTILCISGTLVHVCVVFFKMMRALISRIYHGFVVVVVVVVVYVNVASSCYLCLFSHTKLTQIWTDTQPEEEAIISINLCKAVSVWRQLR